jgi:3-deoxy-manno-octulosonate cytidylyltransferase (CMP-KDO synthetase)
MKKYAFIPARYASSRFPGKPLAQIAGRPMIQRVYERALSCSELTDVFVATDDIRILECVNDFGGKAIMTDVSHCSGTDRIAQAALIIGLRPQDIIVNIQGDQPVFDPAIVSQLVEPIETDPSVVMTTLKHRITDAHDIQNPNHVKVVTDKRGFALYFSRHAIPYVRDAGSSYPCFKHLGFYGFRMDFLLQFTVFPEGVLESAERLEQLRALEYGFKIKVMETDFNSVEVDVPEDVEAVERILNQASSGRLS